MKNLKFLLIGLVAIVVLASIHAPVTEAAIDAVSKLRSQLATVLTDNGVGGYSLNTGEITSTSISDSTIVNADISSTARIAFSKFENLTSGQLLVGSSGHVATKRAITGDVTIGNTGVTAIGSGKVLTAMLATALQPSHVVKYAGFATWSSVGKTKKVAIVGAVATDILVVTPKTAQTSERLVSAYVLKNNTAVFKLYTGEINTKSMQYVVHRAAQ